MQVQISKYKMHNLPPPNCLGESTLWGGQNCCHIVLFFKGTMFELQPSHYYEGFSQ